MKHVAICSPVLRQAGLELASDGILSWHRSVPEIDQGSYNIIYYQCTGTGALSYDTVLQALSRVIVALQAWQ